MEQFDLYCLVGEEVMKSATPGTGIMESDDRQVTASLA